VVVLAMINKKTDKELVVSIGKIGIMTPDHHKWNLGGAPDCKSAWGVGMREESREKLI